VRGRAIGAGLLCTLILGWAGAAIAAEAAAGADWPQWLGIRRDGTSAEVPRELPPKTLLWRVRMWGLAHAGPAVADGRVVVADRDRNKDAIRCLSADRGRSLWTFSYDAPGKMDEGAGPRATPLIHENLVYTLGAFGDLCCLDLAKGTLVWRRNLAKDFAAEVPKWGYSSCPLLADGKLIVNPGAQDASLVALEPKTGKLIWQTPGKPAAYASFIAATFGGVPQIVGYDRESLGGWDPATGKRLWTIVPPNPGDYNVGTPVALGDKLLVSTEQNKTRLYAFAKGGASTPTQVASNEDLALDMATPAVANGLLFGTRSGLTCFDAATLKTRWQDISSDEFDGFTMMIAGQDRVLALAENGVLFLLDADGQKLTVRGRMALCEKTWAHPALAQGRLYVRDARRLYCYLLGESKPK